MSGPGQTLCIFLSLAAHSFAECRKLDSGHPVDLTFGSAGACVAVTALPGQPVRLVIDQPVDLRLQIPNTSPSIAIDGFEFGPETLTLPEIPNCIVEILPAKPTSVPVSVTAKLLPISEVDAIAYRRAEDKATQAKRSGKVPDLELALESWRRLDDASAINRLYIAKGESEVGEANLRDAQADFNKALKGCRTSNDRVCLAAAANDAGWTAQQLGDFDGAVNALEEAAYVFEQLGDLKRQGQSLSNLGLLFRAVGDYQKAIAYYDRARALLQSRDLVANARVLNNLGVCYQWLADYDRAKQRFEAALRDFVAGNAPKDAVRSRLNLGRNYLLQGNLGVAESLLRKALAHAEAIGDTGGRADVLDNLGQALLAGNHDESARSALTEALALHSRIGDKKMEAQDDFYLAETEEKLDSVSAETRKHFQESYDIRISAGARDSAADSVFALVNLDRREGNLDRAKQLAERGLELIESVRNRIPGPELRASFYARCRRFLDSLVDIEVEAGGPKAAEAGFLASDRGHGRAVTDLIVQGHSGPPIPESLRLRRTDLQRKIDILEARLAAAQPIQVPGLHEQIARLTSDNDEIEAAIRQTIPLAIGKPLESLTQLQQALTDDSAILEYHLGTPHSYAWLVSSRDIQMFLLPSRLDIESRATPVIDLFPEILARRRSSLTETKFQQALNALSSVLLSPLAKLSLPTRLVVVPDGILTHVPFAALHLAGGRSLGLSHDLIGTPSAGYLTLARIPRPIHEFTKTFLAAADPIYSDRDPRLKSHPAKLAVQDLDLARLPFTGEFEIVRSQVPADRRRILLGFDATAAALKKTNVEDFAFLEISAHALIDDRLPELSRIALSSLGPAGESIDGFLRPYHLSQLHFNASTVVLSACETALGKQFIGEGIIGLTTSLFSAGAAQLVVTISPVDAEGSSEFLREVYRNVFSPKPVSTEHAMTLARQALSRSARWNDPYYWASFAVYGRPSEALP